MTRIKPFPIGCMVRTPTGRLAKVVRYDRQGRIELRYAGDDDGDVVMLRPGLLKLPQ